MTYENVDSIGLIEAGAEIANLGGHAGEKIGGKRG